MTALSLRSDMKRGEGWGCNGKMGGVDCGVEVKYDQMKLRQGSIEVKGEAKLFSFFCMSAECW